MVYKSDIAQIIVDFGQLKNNTGGAGDKGTLLYERGAIKAAIVLGN